MERLSFFDLKDPWSLHPQGKPRCIGRTSDLTSVTVRIQAPKIEEMFP
jgi:hypothetical protein